MWSGAEFLFSKVQLGADGNFEGKEWGEGNFVFLEWQLDGGSFDGEWSKNK